MSVLAIDPGVTTGIAHLSDSGDLLDQTSLQPDELAYLERYKGRKGLRVVIEETPTPKRTATNAIVRRVLTTLDQYFPSPVLIRPSEWKTHPIGRRRLPKAWYHDSSIHSRDAIRMGLYYILREEKKIR